MSRNNDQWLTLLRRLTPYFTAGVGLLVAALVSVALHRLTERPTQVVTPTTQVSTNLLTPTSDLSATTSTVSVSATTAAQTASVPARKKTTTQTTTVTTTTPSTNDATSPTGGNTQAVAQPTTTTSSPATQTQNPTPSPSPSPSPTPEIVSQVSVSLSVDGGSAQTISLAPESTHCDVLSHALAQGAISQLTMTYNASLNSYGVYQINGLGQANQVWWTYTVNGSSPPLGCSQVRIQANDSISWKYLGPR